MLDWLFASAAERRILPGGRFRGPTPFVIAIMTFAMLIVAAAGLALANAASAVEQGIANRYAVQIPGGDRRLAQALQAVKSTPGVQRAEAVPEREMRATLERWLGPAGASGELPVPALISLELEPTADPQTVGASVERALSGARLVAHQATLEPLLRSLNALQWLAFALVALMAIAAAAAVVLAARGALDTHRPTIDVMHGIGATDMQVTHLFQRKIALDALAGSLAGGAAAVLVLLVVGAGGSAVTGDLTGRAPLGRDDLVLLAALPLFIAALATWVARRAVLTALRRAL
jgi:cell division transport system permease protein